MCQTQRSAAPPAFFSANYSSCLGGITKAKASALVVNPLLLDAGIAPPGYSNAAHHNPDVNNTSTNTNFDNNDFVLHHDYHDGHGQGQGQYYPHSREQNASVSINAADRTDRTDDGTVFADSVINDPRLSRDPRLNNPLPSLPSLSSIPLSSRPHNHSLFATTRDILRQPICAASNTANPPWPQTSRVDSVAHSTLPPLIQHPSLPTPSAQSSTYSSIYPSTYPSTQPWTPTSTQTQVSAPVYQGQLPSLASLRGLLSTPGDYTVHEPLRGQPISPFSEFQGSCSNLNNIVPPSFFSFDTPATTLHQIHMNNNTNFSPALDTSQPQYLPRMTETYRGSDDHFLSALAQNFTSPSLPPLSDPSSPTSLSLSNPSRAATAGQEMPSAVRRHTANRGGGIIDLAKEEGNLDTTTSGVDPSIPLATMPPTTRTRSAPGGADSSNRKRRPSADRLPPSRPSKTRRKETGTNSNSSSSLFGDDDRLPALFEDDEMETIDLSNATEVPQELIAPKVDNRVKIGKFQCVICMDDAAGLTVTHCGR